MKTLRTLTASTLILVASAGFAFAHGGGDCCKTKGASAKKACCTTEKSSAKIEKKIDTKTTAKK